MDPWFGELADVVEQPAEISVPEPVFRINFHKRNRVAGG
jgi:hypothetical protein